MVKEFQYCFDWLRQSDCDDDGETHASSKMLQVLELMKAENVMVSVVVALKVFLYYTENNLLADLEISSDINVCVQMNLEIQL